MSSRAKSKKSKGKSKANGKSKSKSSKSRKPRPKISPQLPMTRGTRGKRTRGGGNNPNTNMDNAQMSEAKRKAKEEELARKAEEEQKERERLEELAKLNQEAHDNILNDYIAQFVDGADLERIKNMQDVDDLEAEEIDRPKPRHQLTSFLEVLLTSEPNKANLHS